MTDARWAGIEVVCTVVIPVAVLTFGGGWLSLVAAVVVAMAAPAAFAVASIAREGRPSALSALSLASVVLTGGIGLWQLDPKWFAVKEAVVPAILGLAIASTAPTRLSVVPVLLDRLLDPARLAEALAAPERRSAYDRIARRGTLQLAALTAASGIGNGILAIAMVRSAPGTEAFTAELGRYTGWSFPLVNLPTIALSVVVLRKVIDRLEEVANVPFEQLLRPTGR
jgi:hypothetical protein